MSYKATNSTYLKLTQQGDLTKLIIYIALSFILLSSQFFLNWRVPDDYLRLSLKPILAIPNTIVQWYNVLQDKGLNKNQLQDRIDILQGQNLILSSRLINLINIESENTELRQLLGVNSVLTKYKTKIAEIKHVANDFLVQSITINLGLGDGLKIGQAVIDADGVVGQVIKVGLLDSKVILISDSSVNIPVYNARNGLRSFVKGNNQQLILQTAEQDFLIQKEDVLLTSGLGETFPKGYPVGKVVAISSGKFITEATIAPAANLKAINQVLVLINEENRPRTGPPNPYFNLE